MATTKKKQPASSAKTTTKKATTRKGTTASRGRKPAKKKPVAASPGWGIFLLSIGVIMFVCAVSTADALILAVVREVVNGVFGSMALPASALIAVLGLQLSMGDRWPFRRSAWGQAAVLLLCISTLLQVFRHETLWSELRLLGDQTYTGYIEQAYKGAYLVRSGGGAFGALLAYPMVQYLSFAVSVLLLFIATFLMLFMLIRTLIPSAGERVSEWFGGLRDDFVGWREDRAEAREYALENPADAALQVPLPEELFEEDYDEEPPRVRARNVAVGRKVKSPVAEPARPQKYQQTQMDWEEPQRQRRPQQASQPPPLQPVRQQPRQAPEPRPRPAQSARQEANKAPGQRRPTKPTTRLYIENTRADRRPTTPPAAEEAYTEYDVERAKYATRPSRKDSDAIPDFILKRREQLDEEYGDTHGFERAEPRAPVELADEPSWDGAPILEEIDYTAQDEPVQDLEPDPYTNAPVQPSDPESVKAAPKRGKVAQMQDHRDKQPQLDPATRLDRPDWKPEEPPQVEEPLPDEEAYRQPPYALLERDEHRARVDTREADAIGAEKLESTLQSFGVSAHVTKVVHGPAITRYELQPAPGVKVSKIVGLTDDIALNMAAVGVRIEAPIPGKAAIGIEIANDEIQTVHLRDVLESDESQRHASKLAVALGKDIAGKRIIADLARMPHLLIAGQTGAGKSVCINTIILSIIYRATPDEVRLILIDPKKVELAAYNGIPHLLVPVVTDPKKASGALAWAVMEMDERYKLFAEVGVRDIKGYNAHRDPETPLMPQIVVIIDELSDLMLVAPGEVEESICRIAQLARACGIHLIVATQRPSVNVITGIIKANIPSRIAFLVASQVDSRTILDTAGADKLLGRGDMLFAPTGGGKPQRVQGCFVSDDEVNRVVEFVKDRHVTDYSQAVIEALDTVGDAQPAASEDGGGAEEDFDPLFEQAVEMAIELGQASISMVQRRLRVGYARAGRIIDDMASRGIISQAEGAKPRDVLMSREEFNVMFGK